MNKTVLLLSACLVASIIPGQTEIAVHMLN